MCFEISLSGIGDQKYWPVCGEAFGCKRLKLLLHAFYLFADFLELFDTFRWLAICCFVFLIRLHGF